MCHCRKGRKKLFLAGANFAATHLIHPAHTKLEVARLQLHSIFAPTIHHEHGRFV